MGWSSPFLTDHKDHWTRRALLLVCRTAWRWRDTVRSSFNGGHIRGKLVSNCQQRLHLIRPVTTSGHRCVLILSHGTVIHPLYPWDTGAGHACPVEDSDLVCLRHRTQAWDATAQYLNTTTLTLLGSCLSQILWQLAPYTLDYAYTLDSASKLWIKQLSYSSIICTLISIVVSSNYVWWILTLP